MKRKDKNPPLTLISVKCSAGSWLLELARRRILLRITGFDAEEFPPLVGVVLSSPVGVIVPPLVPLNGLLAGSRFTFTPENSNVRLSSELLRSNFGFNRSSEKPPRRECKKTCLLNTPTDKWCLLTNFWMRIVREQIMRALGVFFNKA